MTDSTNIIMMKGGYRRSKSFGKGSQPKFKTRQALNLMVIAIERTESDLVKVITMAKDRDMSLP